MKNLAIITARSGSKGLKDKNIKMLNGKELMAYSIIAAQESEMFEEIYVSTDSVLYADIARKWGANVPFLRSDSISGDKASSWDAVREAVKEYGKLGKFFDTVTLLQPTSPLRTSDDIRNGYIFFDEKKANYVVGVCEMEHSPLWSNTLPNTCSMSGFMTPESDKPRQELPVYYRLNGALYIVRTQCLTEPMDWYGDKSFAYIMPRERSIDIDSELDFKMAEFMLGYISK